MNEKILIFINTLSGQWLLFITKLHALTILGHGKVLWTMTCDILTFMHYNIIKIVFLSISNCSTEKIFSILKSI